MGGGGGVAPNTNRKTDQKSDGDNSSFVSRSHGLRSHCTSVKSSKVTLDFVLTQFLKKMFSWKGYFVDIYGSETIREVFFRNKNHQASESNIRAMTFVTIKTGTQHLTPVTVRGRGIRSARDRKRGRDGFVWRDEGMYTHLNILLSVWEMSQSLHDATLRGLQAVRPSCCFIYCQHLMPILGTNTFLHVFFK